MKESSVIVVGAGMGGLAAALYLARAGVNVKLFEGRAKPGGLASGVTIDKVEFDGGPYILLDRPGLEWAFDRLGVGVDQLKLRRIEDIYQVTNAQDETVSFFASLDKTADLMDQQWPGAGKKYRQFVATTEKIHCDLSPMLYVSRPSPLKLVTTGGLHRIPFLLKPLGKILESTGLPQPVIDAVGIWTHVAGQELSIAPSPLAFVPSLMHGAGSWYPKGGIAMIPELLMRALTAAGAELTFSRKVTRIKIKDGTACGVETEDGEVHSADAVLSDCGGHNTYLLLSESGISKGLAGSLERMPLQSPGVCAYLQINGPVTPPYLRFRLPRGGRELTRLFIQTEVADPGPIKNWRTARLIAPMRHDDAERVGPSGQERFLEKILAEDWWKEGVITSKVLATRTPANWGEEYSLFRSSMNPVMTSRFMRSGRMRHKSPYVKRLYLSGSSTHPGQWISFCAISGVLVAEQILKDLARFTTSFPSGESSF